MRPPDRIGRRTLIPAFAAGAAFWTVLLGAGRPAFDSLDWVEQRGRLAAVREGVATGRMPWRLRVARASAVALPSTPDVVWSPLLPLLPWLPDGAFALGHVLLCYAVGFAGLARLAAARGWTGGGFLLFFIVFHGGGHPVTHLAAGHLMWAAYLLLPWFLLEVDAWSAGGTGAALAARTAAVVSLISLSGAFHLAHGCLIAVGCLAARTRKSWPAAALAGLLTAGATAVRWLPAVYALRRTGWIRAWGFPDAGTFVAAFVSVRPPGTPPVAGMGWWEFDHFTGLVAAALLAGLGLGPLVRSAVTERSRAATAMLGCIGAMTLLSLGRIYTWTLTAVPGLGAERVVTRLVVMPLLLVALTAAGRFGGFAADLRRRWPAVPAAGLLLAVAALELLRHAMAWLPAGVRSAFPAAAPPVAPIPLFADDPVQRTVLWTGATISAAAWIGLWIVLRRPPAARPTPR